MLFTRLRSLLNVSTQLERVENHLHRIAKRLQHLEIVMSDIRSEFNAALTDLATGIDDLATRITELPDDPKDLTAEDLAAIKGLSDKVKGLAVAAPEVPITDDGVQTPGEGTVPPAGDPGTADGVSTEPIV